MNGAQSKECYRILEDTRMRCVAGVEVTASFGVFKEAVLDNSVLRTSMQEVLAAEAAVAAGDVTLESRESGAGEVVVGDKIGAPREEGAAVAISPPKGLQNRLFTPQMVKSLCDYAAQGIFSHYRLYQSVFTAKKFKPRKQIVTNPLKIDSIVTDELKLDAAIDPIAAHTVHMACLK
jgi:hypothetical protein